MTPYSHGWTLTALVGMVDPSVGFLLPIKKQVASLRHVLGETFPPSFLFSSAVERTTVNRLVPGSIPGRGVGCKPYIQTCINTYS